MQQKSDPWIDKDGKEVQKKRVSKLEFFEETHSTRILTKALRIEKLLYEFNEYVKEAAEKALKEFEKANPNRKERDGHTWYNFDHTIKIVSDVQPTYSYDANGVREIGEKFTPFIDGTTTDTKEGKLLKSILNKVFLKTDGSIDHRALEQIMGFENKTDIAEFKDIVKLLKGIRKKTGTNVYFRIWIKDEEKNWRIVQLNHSRINNA